MPGPEWLNLPLAPLPVPGAVLAYVGLGPGQELIPYFFALVGFVGTALLAILQCPILALRHFFSRTKAADRPKDEAAAADVPEPPREASPDKP